ncbi:MAG TPA: zf-HC2 domain-containing protein [Acidobacteriota bacterium]|jgi:predicted anti-sigma-YlaC factor YlaD
MREACKWFDQYRDGELNHSQRALFESHLDSCVECRQALTLLDNVARAIAAVDAPLRPAFARDTATVAFQPSRSWDALLVSWLRPARAWPAWALLVILCASLLLFSFGKHGDAYADYEVLLTGSENSAFARDMAQIRNDDDLLRWLQQGGNNR